MEKIKNRVIKLLIKFSSNKRPSSYPFISGDSLRTLADHIHDETSIFNPQNVIGGDIIFVKSDMLNDFFNKIHPQIQNRYVLISHNSDENIDEKYSKYIDEKIIHWFAQNLMFEHPKVSAIPIGLENKHYYRNGIPSLFKKIQNNKIEKKNRILFGFNVNTNKSERTPALINLRKCTVADEIETPLEPRKYLELLNQYKFVASPPGNGVDCIRTWEAITVGTIPICLNNQNTKHFMDSGAPILSIESFGDLIHISEYDLENHYDSINQKSNFDLRYFDYWQELIKSKKHEYN